MLRFVPLSFLLLLMAGMAGPNAQAGVRLLMEHKEGRSEMLLEGTKARINPPQEGFSLLFDASSGVRLMVSTKHRQVVEMPAKSPEKGQAPDTDLREQGSGPEVAGYATTRYVLQADGKPCGEILASPEALADLGGAETTRVFRGMSGGPQGRNFTPGPCELAFENLAKHFGEIGFPLRVRGSDGNDSRVVRIGTGVRFEPGTFAAPEGYERRSLKGLMGGE